MTTPKKPTIEEQSAKQFNSTLLYNILECQEEIADNIVYSKKTARQMTLPYNLYNWYGTDIDYNHVHNT